MVNLLITGTAGFIYSNFYSFALDQEAYNVTAIDKLVEPWNTQTVRDGLKCCVGDVSDAHFVDRVFELTKPDIVLHGAAESNVDQSFHFAEQFCKSNIVGTQVLVDASIKHGVSLFYYASTDEVYGQLTDRETRWRETDACSPRNPYAMSKLAGELAVKAAKETHGLPYIISRSCNNYGPNQSPRNLVPRIVAAIESNRPVELHGDGTNIREWLYVADHCNIIKKLLSDGRVNETYNIGSGLELSNKEMVDRIAVLMKKKYKVKYVEDRKCHDWRYALDTTKLQAVVGPIAMTPFDVAMRKTINDYRS